MRLLELVTPGHTACGSSAGSYVKFTDYMMHNTAKDSPNADTAASFSGASRQRQRNGSQVVTPDILATGELKTPDILDGITSVRNSSKTDLDSYENISFSSDNSRENLVGNEKSNMKMCYDSKNYYGVSKVDEKSLNSPDLERDKANSVAVLQEKTRKISLDQTAKNDNKKYENIKPHEAGEQASSPKAVEVTLEPLRLMFGDESTLNTTDEFTANAWAEVSVRAIYE